jgi:hypothetical protein
MRAKVLVGFFSEGNTDARFFESIIEHTFIDISFECDKDIDIELFPIKINKANLSFITKVSESSKKGFGMTTLCVHTDADDVTKDNTYNNKINPAIQHIITLNQDEYCTLLTPLVPVQMTESWMLADIDLLKKEIGTTKSINELGLNREPETITDPKNVIIEAIRISRQELTRRKRTNLSIDELYQSIGSKIELEKLDKLQSFRDFKKEIRNTYRALNHLR